MDEIEQLTRLGTALAAGLLVGIERGWQGRDTDEGRRVAGVRTYGLVGLLGGLVGLVGAEAPAVVASGLVAVTAVFIVAYAISSKRSNDVGVTSLIAAVLTFGFGVVAARGHISVAAAAAVVTTLLLGGKPTLHRWLESISSTEMKATLKLLLISVVVLPALPNQGYGPWNALNPYTIWWMVVLVAMISFAGYIAMRTVGSKRGIALTGLFGGLVSSTASTLHLSRLARAGKLSPSLLAFGILVSCGTMFPRIAIVTAAVNHDLLPKLAIPLALMAAIVYGSSLILWRTSDGDGVDKDAAASVENPLQLGSALRFGALLAAIMVAAAWLGQAFGDSGLLVLAAVSGLTDVDAISLSLAEMSTRELAATVALSGIVIAAASNSLVKGAMSGLVGGAGLGKYVIPPLVLAAATGLAWIGLT